MRPVDRIRHSCLPSLTRAVSQRSGKAGSFPASQVFLQSSCRTGDSQVTSPPATAGSPCPARTTKNSSRHVAVRIL